MPCQIFELSLSRPLWSGWKCTINIMPGHSPFRYSCEAVAYPDVNRSSFEIEAPVFKHLNCIRMFSIFSVPKGLFLSVSSPSVLQQKLYILSQLFKKKLQLLQRYISEILSRMAVWYTAVASGSLKHAQTGSPQDSRLTKKHVRALHSETRS